jgi:UDP-N-acetylglucosamine diphosphorylase/glucosamine-1-phosphate N-acetyltransferase
LRNGTGTIKIMKKVTKAVIMAAGEGTRMRPLTYTRPKVMLPLATKPILEHLVIEMSRAGIEEFVFVVGYHDEQIKNYFGVGDHWGIKIQYCNQIKQQGTADAVRMVEDQIKDNFLLANGDVIVDRQDIAGLISLNHNALSAIELPNVSGLGVLEVKGGAIIRIHEKTAEPPSHLVNAGVYLFTPDIFAAIRDTPKSLRGEYEITDSIQWLIDKGHEVSYRLINQWFDLSYPWDLLTTNEKIMSRLESQQLGEIEPNAVVKGPVSVGKGSIIRSGSYIVGPVIIGENCDIGPHCFIRPSTAIGDNCHIGASVEVKNSIVMTGSKIPHLSYVGDSVIGENCNLGAGTKIANLRLDKKNVVVNGKDTGRRKLGAIIGDNVQTGINCSINLGTLIGNNTLIGPGALAHGIIPPKSKIF